MAEALQKGQGALCCWKCPGEKSGWQTAWSQGVAAGCLVSGARFKRTYEWLCYTVTINHAGKGGEISICSVPSLCQAPQERGTPT